MPIDIIITFATREVAQLTIQKTEATLESVPQVGNPLILEIKSLDENRSYEILE